MMGELSFRLLARPRLLTALLMLTIAGSGALGAQETIETYPRRDIDEVPEPYRTWYLEEVTYLITEDERDVFLRLDSEIKYQRFVERFWLERDPTPGTPANEYYDLHYERLAYANKFYGRGSPFPGWRSARGRAHILLGEPESKTRIPSEMLIYPLEVWFYSADPELGLPPFFYLMFYQRHGGGDYRLYSPLSDGPERLLNGQGLREVERRMERNADRPIGTGYSPTGYGQNAEAVRSILMEVNFDLASAAFSYFPSEVGLEFGISPLSTEILIGSIAAIPEVIMPDATWALNVLTGVADSDVRFETLDVAAAAVPLIDVDGEPFIHFATETPGEQLNVGEYDDSYYFSFRTVGSVVEDETRVLQNFEATMSGDLEPEQARSFTSNAFIYMDLVPTLSGRQHFSVMLENSVAHTFGRAEMELDVPRAHPPVPIIAGPVLALDTQTRPFDPFGDRFPFQYRDLAMVPAVGRTFDIGRPIHVFEQVLLPSGFQGAITARYGLLNASGSTVRRGDTVLDAAAADEHGVLPVLFSIDTAGLAVGEYLLQVSLDENVNASRSERLQLREPPAEPARPFINAQAAPPAIDVEVALERAAQHRIKGEIERATEWLRYAQEREPEDPEIRARYVELLEQTGGYEALIELLEPIAIENPRDVGTLTSLARAYALSGQHYDAIRFYERARIAMSDEDPEILNALANEYIAEGRPEKAVELLQMSLGIRDDQPEIRAMLERLTTATPEPQQR